MRPSEIRDSSLRSWAEMHVSKSLEECRSRKASTDTLLDIWKSYSEGDWGALRELIPLRARCKALGIERSEQEIAVQRRIRRGPYSLGAEVAALQGLIEARRGSPDFNDTATLDLGDFKDQ